MKKRNIVLLIFLCLFLGVCIYFYANPTKLKEVYKKCEEFYYNKFEEKIDSYNEDYRVNSIDYASTYYYLKLNDDEKIIYDYVAYAVKNLKNEIYLQKYEYVDDKKASEDINKAITYFLLDNPEVFYLKQNYLISTNSSIFGTKISLKFEYLVDSNKDLEDKIGSIKEKVDYIKSEVVKDEIDPYQIELKVHDYIAKNTEYYKYDNTDEIPNEYHNIYGALVENKAVCDGFAKTFQLILGKYGIDSIVVTGTLENEPHAWNLVNINDNWYNVDITSAKSIKIENKAIVVHSYFNVTDETILKTHKFDNKDILPTCENTEYNYYVKENKVIKLSENFNERIKNIVENSDEILEFYTTDYTNVPEKLAVAVVKIKNNGFILATDKEYSYYNILNTYIMVKK